jgi:hypothetical protein
MGATIKTLYEADFAAWTDETAAGSLVGVTVGARSRIAFASARNLTLVLPWRGKARLHCDCYGRNNPIIVPPSLNPLRHSCP